MQLPVMPPISPMLATAASSLPAGEHFSYEPKWDGFRAIAFRDGDEVAIQSRNTRPLGRYFPEVEEALRAMPAQRVVLDGEIVIATEHGLDFDLLQLRLHPAASRVATLAASSPATLVAFDLLALGDDDVRPAPFGERRRRLDAARAELAGVLVSPATTDVALAADWFKRFEGAGFDGVVAKDVRLPYREGERVMVKVKHERSADCVVGGFRWHKDGHGVGSLLLGLYDDAATLQHVGVASSFSAAIRRALVEQLAPYRLEDGAPHPWHDATDERRRPGVASRWSADKDLSFVALRPELVCEVAYDHLQGDRFRHATRFERWRPDRDAASCTYRQLEVVAPAELEALFR